MKNFVALGLLLSSTAFARGIDQTVLSNQDPFKAVMLALKKAGIVDDVCDEFQPTCLMGVQYSSTDKVALGNIMDPADVSSTPSTILACTANANGGLSASYTIVMTDPDVPADLSTENFEWAEMAHWIAKIPSQIPGIPGPPSGKHSTMDLFVGGNHGYEIVLDYKPPAPPAGTGLHRYTFLVLEGDNSNITAPDVRKNWGFGDTGAGVRDWIEAHGLKVAGANFFYSQNADDDDDEF